MVSSARRAVVHVALIGTAAVSLAVEPLLTAHILLGLGFVGFVGAHLVQRSRITRRLARQLRRPRSWPKPAGRLAWSDAALTVLTVVMLGSGLWDWLMTPTHIRWHAISGVLLAGYLVVHTVRRRRQLTRSQVR